MQEIHKENLQNHYTKNGIFVIHTVIGNWLKFGKKLFAAFNEYKGFNPKVKKLQNENNTTIQNYPNPFNPTTQIKYSIPSKSKVSIKIYDILGKEIAILVDNQFQNAGMHSVQWGGKDVNGNQVSSGIYYCRVVNNFGIQTIKLMLIR